MNKLLICAVVLGLLATAPAFAQKVYLDYDKEYDFAKVKSFAWSPNPENTLEERYPLAHSRIVNAIEHYLTMGGLIEVEQDPDIFVTYHTASEKEFSVNTSTMGYGYPSSWYWSPYWYGSWGPGYATSSTSVTSYTKGTLLVDLWDARTKKMIWRGSAVATVPENPEKAERLIDRALEKIVARWKKDRKSIQKEKPAGS